MADDRERASVGWQCQAMPRAVCRRFSSSSESGFNSDLSDNVSPPALTDAAVPALNGLGFDEGCAYTSGTRRMLLVHSLHIGKSWLLSHPVTKAEPNPDLNTNPVPNPNPTKP